MQLKGFKYVKPHSWATQREDLPGLRLRVYRGGYLEQVPKYGGFRSVTRLAGS